MKKLSLNSSIKTGLRIFLILFYFEINAQPPCNIQDSLALVEFYWSTDGPNWYNNDNWLSGRVFTWWGVGVYNMDSTRIRGINFNSNNLTGFIPESFGVMNKLVMVNMRYNNLTGNIPASLVNLDWISDLGLNNNKLTGFAKTFIGFKNLQIIHLENNEFTGSFPEHFSDSIQYLSEFNIRNNHFESLPDFTQNNYFQYMAIVAENNKLTFEDLEPNISAGAMYYIPQDSVLTPQTLTARLDSSFTLTSTVGGTANYYQWFKNGDTLQGATDSILYFPFVAWADSGVYTCHITNDIVTGLTLTRHPITLHVSDTITSSSKLQAQSIKFKAFPNPVISGNEFTIYSSEKNINSVIEIYNVTGELIYSQPTQTNRTKINTEKLGKGVFWVKVKNSEGLINVEKLIIL